MRRSPLALVAAVMLAGCSSGISDVAPAADIDSGSNVDAARDGAGPIDSAVDGGATDGGGTSDGGGATDGGVGDGISFDAGSPCTVSSSGESTGCAADEYCDSPSCATGTCKARPGSHPEHNPVCGCDGVTYWNPPFAHSQGRSTRGPGACAGASAKSCGGLVSGGCAASGATGMKCVVSGADVSVCTTSDLGGKCWSLPPDADCSGGGTKTVRTCTDSACLSPCNATKGSRVFYDDATCSD